MKSSQVSWASSTPEAAKCGNLYDDLELDRLANPEDIKAAFRRMALDHHPDKTCSVSTDQFLRAREAWEVLGDEGKRRMYDEKLKQRDPPDHVCQEVRWGDLLMSEEEEEDGNHGMRYYWPCRCGDFFEVEKEDGKVFGDQYEDDDGRSLKNCPGERKGQKKSLVVGCVSCSLHIRVLPTRSTLLSAQDTEKDKQILRKTVLYNGVFLKLILEVIGERQWLFLGGVCKSWRDCCKKMKGDYIYSTSPLEALQSLSRLHMALDIGLDLVNTLIKKSESSWLGSPGSEACWGAAQAGRLGILQELHRSMPYNFEELIPVAAAKAPTPNVLEWLKKENIGDWGNEQLKLMIRDTASCGRIENAVWLREACSAEWHRATCFYAAQHNQLEFLQWARNVGCPWGNMLGFCQLSGNMANRPSDEMFSWVHQCDSFPCDCIL